MRSEMKNSILIALLAVAVLVAIVCSIVYYETTETDIEGEVLGKENRQVGFMGSGTPDFLIINGTGKVWVDSETFHQYEVGDHFTESIALSKFGTGYEIADVLMAILPLMMVVLVIAIVGPIMMRGVYR